MKARILRAKAEGDSVGGEIECAVTGIPAGIGEPMFGGVESRIAQIVYGIPAVKALHFGIGPSVGNIPGSECNDAFCIQDGIVKTKKYAKPFLRLYFTRVDHDEKN